MPGGLSVCGDRKEYQQWVYLCPGRISEYEMLLQMLDAWSLVALVVARVAIVGGFVWKMD
jgi:hypothetical protein